MTRTDDLIANLAAQGAEPAVPAWRLAMWPLLVPGLLCALALLVLLGDPFAPAMEYGPGPMIVKWGFSLPLVIGGAAALYGLGKPARRVRGRLAFLSLPFLATGALVALSLAEFGSGFPGATWRTCLAAMTLISPLAFAGAIHAARQLAPTDLRTTGMVAGLFGGGVAMTAYAPFCPELGMAYMVVFYCLPIVVMAAAGWALGPRLLRW